MSVLDPNWKPMTPLQFAEDEVENTDLITSIGGRDYRVIDGDTIKDLETGESHRLEGLTAREVAKPAFYSDEGTGLSKGEAGGLDQRYTLWKVLQDDNFKDGSVNVVGTQEYGAGAGSRSISRIAGKQGDDVADVLHRTGLMGLTDQTDQRGLNEASDGRLLRSMVGSSDDEAKWGYLRDLREDEPVVFKGLALDEDWYNPDFYAGVAFDDANVENWNPERGHGGGATNPISAAWDLGWTNSKADFGAALDALGTGVSSDWLSDVGNNLRVEAGVKLADAPKLNVQQLQDIRTDGFVNGSKDLLEWLAVNTTMSLPYMASIAAPALVLAPFTGGGSIAGAGAAFAAASVPSTILHTGNVWNNIDPENKNATNAGFSIAAGFGMGLLDRLGLKGLSLKPSQILTKEGQDLAVAHLIKTKGMTRPDALLHMNTLARDEAAAVIKHMGVSAQKHIAKGNVLKAALKGVVNAAPYEAVTEAGQELTSYLTAAAINGDKVDPEELGWILANSAAAGGAVGGAFGAAGGTISAGKQYALSKGYEPFNMDTLNEYSKVFSELRNTPGGDPDGSISDQIINTKEVKAKTFGGFTNNEFLKAAAEAQQDPAWRDYTHDEQGNFAPTPIKALEGVLHYTGRLVKAPLLNWVKPDDLRNNEFIRTMVGRVMNNRGIGGSGKHFESRLKYVKGQLDALFSQRKIIDAFNIGSSNAALKAWSTDFRKFGSSGAYAAMKKARKNGKVLSDRELASYGITDRAHATKLYKYAADAERMGHISFNMERDALIMEYGKDSDTVKNFNATRNKTNWYDTRSPDAHAVAKDPAGFQVLVQKAMDVALADASISSEDKTLIRSKTAADRVAEITDNPNSNDEGFSLVGGNKWAGKSHMRRVLNVADIDGFSAFATDNVFATYQIANAQAAKRIAHLEYFGDGGSDLDVLVELARLREIELGATEEQAAKKVARLAKVMKDAIDASSGNYNRIQNKTLATIQQNLGGYMSIVGLALSAPASIPEFGVLLMESTRKGELGKAVVASMSEIIDGVSKAFSESSKAVHNKVRPGTPIIMGEANIDERYQKEKILESLGINETAGQLFQKIGVDESLPNSLVFRKFIDKFFTFTAIRGITSVQRRIGLGLSFDFAYNRLLELAAIPVGREYTADEGMMYEQLRALGMDVDKMIGVMRSGSIHDSSGLSFESPFERSVKLNQEERIIEDEMSTFTTNFINERIQNPGAFNRALIFQDPHYAILTLFNGFLSTATANLVPKLWNDKAIKGIRHLNPALTYQGFSVAIIMIVLGGVGQWMRDYIKYDGEQPDWLSDKDLVHRAVLSSGLLGQYEKLLDQFAPLYGKNEGAGERFGGTVFGAAGRFAENFAEVPGGKDWHASLNSFLKNVPFTSIHTGLREEVTDLILGDK